MRYTLRAETAPSRTRHESTHKTPIFTKTNLRKLSGIPIIQKIVVEEETLVELMVSIQLELERARQEERAKVILYDPTYLSGLVALSDVNPIRTSFVASFHSDWPFTSSHRDTFQYRGTNRYDIMSIVTEEEEEDEDEYQEGGEVDALMSPKADSTVRFTELISPKQFHTVESMIDKHLESYLDADSDYVLDLRLFPFNDVSTSKDSARTSRYDRKSTTLAKSDHDELSLSQVLGSFPQLETSGVDAESCQVSLISTVSVVEAEEHFERDERTNSDAKSQETATTSTLTESNDSNLEPDYTTEVGFPVHLRSPWAEDMDHTFPVDDLIDRAILQDQSIYTSSFEFLAKAPEWDHLPRHPRSKSLDSQMSTVSKFRTTRLPSASL